MAALLGDWSETGITLKCGSSRYRLRSTASAAEVTLDGMPVAGEWIELVDDGREHVALFPPRRPAPILPDDACPMEAPVEAIRHGG